MMTGEVVTVASLYTDYTADSTEWCPCPCYSDVLLCGMYQLVDSDGSNTATGDQGLGQQHSGGSRKGRLSVYVLNEDFLTSDSPALLKVTETDTSAILDIKWSHCFDDENPVFSVVDSEGLLSVWQLAATEDQCVGVRSEHGLKISKVSSLSLGGNKLALSLDWSDRVERSSSRIIASDSQGMVSLVTVDSCHLDVSSQWKAHDFEAWIAAFNYWNTNIVYSGGDDCVFKGWDTRLPPDCVLFMSRKHSAGVCSIQCHPKNEHILATGSYDEHVLLWDTRQMKRPVSETSMGGGVWRVKWDPWQADYLLTASMYNGFHVMDCSSISESGQQIVCSYMEHSSIAYGADWCSKLFERTCVQPVSRAEGGNEMTDPEERSHAALIGTCSFYDHLLKLWFWCGPITS